MALDPRYRFAAALLRHPRARSLREISSDPIAKMTANQAYPVARWFEFHGALTKRDDHYETDLKRLVDLLSAQRLRSVVPAATHHVGGQADDAHRRLDDAGIRHIFAFTTAANMLVYFEPLPHMQLYVDKTAAAKVRHALRPGKIPLEVYTARLAEIPQESGRRGVPRTDLLRTTVDVNAHPFGGAHAGILRQALAEAYA